MKIGNREVGPHVAPLIVAEIGLAHMGNVGTAISYAGAAFEAGADAVKFQHHIASEEMVPDHPWYSTIESHSLTLGELAQVKAEVEGMGVEWLCTPFSVRAVHELDSLGVRAWKVGSGEVSHVPMLEAIASLDPRPVIMSTGLHSAEEWAESASRMPAEYPVIPLACVSQYPTLGPIDVPGKCWTVANELSHVDDTGESVWGWSDHTGDIAAALGAIAHGASIIEIHFPRIGPDAASSIYTHDLERLCELAPAVWEACVPPAPEVDDSAIRRVARHDLASGLRTGYVEA